MKSKFVLRDLWPLATYIVGKMSTPIKVVKSKLHGRLHDLGMLFIVLQGPLIQKPVSCSLEVLWRNLKRKLLAGQECD